MSIPRCVLDELRHDAHYLLIFGDQVARVTFCELSQLFLFMSTPIYDTAKNSIFKVPGSDLSVKS